MRVYDIILKKRNGGELTAEEIDFMIQGFTAGRVPDYQMAAFLMAVYFQGMNPRETADLTMSMVHSGETVDLSPVHGIKVDKHSTGGVGDKTSLPLTSMVAACGAPVAKMSGRGLGHTGGTIDKLESFPGFQTVLTKEQFFHNVNTIGVAVVGQSANLTPADKKMYALRDVTATVDSLPLIASSVMSKKIAGGADAIVLDVKTGSGAFMKALDDSFALAKAMVEIGSRVGRKTAALVTDMDQPLGFAVGNALEVKEAIDTLKGQGPADLTELCLALGSQMLLFAGAATTAEDARKKLLGAIQSGAALRKFREFVAAQGGDASLVDHPEKLPQAVWQIEVLASQDGFVEAIQAEEVGLTAMVLGAGRETKESAIDLAVGIVLCKKVGDAVKNGEPLAVIHANNMAKVSEVKERLLKAFRISDKPVSPHKLIYGLVTAEGITRY